MNVTTENIARICHEANRAYCIAIGEEPQPHFEDAPEWQVKSAINGVQAILEGKSDSCAANHHNWMLEKLKDGWRYGEVKDAEKKEHPCLLPYDALPREQQFKDFLFGLIVFAIRDKLTEKPSRSHSSNSQLAEAIIGALFGDYRVEKVEIVTGAKEPEQDDQSEDPPIMALTPDDQLVDTGLKNSDLDPEFLAQAAAEGSDAPGLGQEDPFAKVD